VRPEYALICRSIEQLVDGTYAAIGVESNVQIAPTLPCQGIARLLVKLQGPPGSHPFRVRVIAPDLQVAGEEMRTNIDLAPAPGLPPGWDCRIMVPMQIIFPVEQAGTYSIEVRGSGTHSIDVPFLIHEAPATS
jgi:hypothetical protein